MYGSCARAASRAASRDACLVICTCVCTQRDPAFQELGGVRYMADLIDRAPPAARAPDYAAHLVDLALRRDMIKIAEFTSSAWNWASLSAEATSFAASKVRPAKWIVSAPTPWACSPP